MKNIPASIVYLWMGASLVFLGRYPNQLTALIFDRWMTILIFVSLMVIAFGFCRRFKWHSVKKILIAVCILFGIAILNFSIWLLVQVQNNTSVPLTAVMKDLSNSNVRIVSIPPHKSKWVELISGGESTFRNKKWHLLIYDGAGTIYFQDIIEGDKIKTRHSIEINPQPLEE